MKWFEMSYYQKEKEERETLAQKLRNENNSCRSCQEWEILSYCTFEEDDYSEESEA